MASSPLKIGVIREGKQPPDSRVPLTPEQAAGVSANPAFDLVVQPSQGRCFSDDAYAAKGVELREDLSDREVLIGVKEVPIEKLQPGCTYFFFSHTHKKQVYNRELLQAILAKRIRMIDYELLTNAKDARLIAFGRFAGMVGAHHGLRAWGLRSKQYDLPQMVNLEDYAAAKEAYAKTHFGDLRVVVTGTGRVGKGAAQVLLDAGLSEVDPDAFLEGKGEGAVFTRLGVKRYVRREDRAAFTKQDFYANPGGYESTFLPYCRQADVLVHGIFWDNRAPAMFSLTEMATPGFRVSVIADVTCDIHPVTSIPATRKASTIADPYFGFDPRTELETEPFAEHGITMMTVDNLPNEMPRDASAAFGEMFVSKILPELLQLRSEVLEGATIAKNGQLTERYAYLQDFVDAKA